MINYHLSTLSFLLGVGFLSISSVLTLPLFPSQRERNDLNLFLRITLVTLCSTFITHEIQFLGRTYEALYNLFRKIVIKLISLKRFVVGLFQLIRRKNADNENDSSNSYFLRFDMKKNSFCYKRNYLARAFFAGYICLQFRIFYECETLKRVAVAIEVYFAILLMTALNAQNKYSRGTWLSQLGWIISAVVSFNLSIQAVVEEVIMSYIDIIKTSLEDPNSDYGLNLNVSTAEKYNNFHGIFGRYSEKDIKSIEDNIYLLFKLPIRCYKNELKTLEFYAPFASEFYALSTFFCVFVWKNLSRNDEIENQDEHEKSLSRGSFPRISVVWQKLSCISCALNLNFIVLLMSIFLTGTTTAQINGYERSKMKEGIVIFTAQQLLLQALIFLYELIFYLTKLRKLQLRVPKFKLPYHYQLDYQLLIFPLLPLGIIGTLEIVPFLAGVQNANFTQLPSEDKILVAFYMFKSIFSWIQVAFQGIFITELFFNIELNKKELKKYKFFFLTLAGLNFLVWGSWSFELKNISIHGLYYKIYGVIVWVVVSYATVPFVLFCYAHTSATFVILTLLISNNENESYVENNVPINSELINNQDEFPSSCGSFENNDQTDIQL